MRRCAGAVTVAMALIAAQASTAPSPRTTRPPRATSSPPASTARCRCNPCRTTATTYSQIEDPVAIHANRPR